MSLKSPIKTASYVLPLKHANRSNPYLADGPEHQKGVVPHRMWITSVSLRLAFYLTLCHAFSMRYIALIFLVLMTACAHNPKQTKKVVSSSEKKMSKIRATTNGSTVSVEKLRAARDQKELLKEKAMVSSKKINVSKASGRPALLTQKQSSSNVLLRVNPQTKQATAKLVSPLTPAKDEKTLLAEMRLRFERGDEFGLFARYKAYSQSYAKSKNAAEAHFMAGMTYLSLKDYGRALKSFSAGQVSPVSNFVAKNHFAKGVTYRKLNLLPTAQTVLAEVVKKYPGTPESLRAEAELKILKGNRSR